MEATPWPYNFSISSFNYVFNNGDFLKRHNDHK
jgi:hypothetical protein